ncbi:unnamed protein product, partial [Symbiodinium microadriaticum]
MQLEAAAGQRRGARAALRFGVRAGATLQHLAGRWALPGQHAVDAAAQVSVPDPRRDQCRRWLLFQCGVPGRRHRSDGGAQWPHEGLHHLGPGRPAQQARRGVLDLGLVATARGADRWGTPGRLPPLHEYRPGRCDLLGLRRQRQAFGHGVHRHLPGLRQSLQGRGVRRDQHRGRRKRG